MSGERVERRLAAILAADVAGYSRLMGQDEAGTLARLRTHRRELIEPRIGEHKGRIVKTTGDGMLVEFPSVVEAVACAVAVQRGMTERNAEIPDEQRIVFHLGINLGDVIVEAGDIYGDGVNVAARLEALAEPGGICVSRTVRDHIGDRLDVTFDDLGDQSLKNIARPIRVYRVRVADAATTSASINPTPPNRSIRRSMAKNSIGPVTVPTRPCAFGTTSHMVHGQISHPSQRIYAIKLPLSTTLRSRLGLKRSGPARHPGWRAISISVPRIA